MQGRWWTPGTSWWRPLQHPPSSLRTAPSPLKQVWPHSSYTLFHALLYSLAWDHLHTILYRLCGSALTAVVKASEVGSPKGTCFLAGVCRQDSGVSMPGQGQWLKLDLLLMTEMLQMQR